MSYPKIIRRAGTKLLARKGKRLAEHCCPFIYIYYLWSYGDANADNHGIACFDSHTLKLMWAEEHPPLHVTEHVWPGDPYFTIWQQISPSEMRIYNHQILWGYLATQRGDEQTSEAVWDNTTVFQAGWYVSYTDGWTLTHWRALQTNSGQTPAENAYWTTVSVLPYFGPACYIGFDDLTMRAKSNIKNPIPNYTDGLVDVPSCFDFFNTTDGKVFILTKYIDSATDSGAHIYCLDSAGTLLAEIKKKNYRLARIAGSLESDGVFRLYAVGHKIEEPNNPLPEDNRDSVFCFSFDGSAFTEDWHYVDDSTVDDSYEHGILGSYERGYTLLVPKPMTSTLGQCIVVSMVNHSGGTYEGGILGGIIDAYVSVITDGVRDHQWILRVENPTRAWVSTRSYKSVDHAVRITVVGMDTFQDTWKSKIDGNVGHQPPNHGAADDGYWTTTLGTQSGLSYMGSFGDTEGDTYSAPQSGFRLREHLECALAYRNGNHWLYLRGNSDVMPSSLYRLNLTTGAAAEELASITFSGSKKPKLMGLPMTLPDPWSFDTILQMWQGEAHIVALADLETATHSIVTTEIITPTRPGYSQTPLLISPRLNRELKFTNN